MGECAIALQDGFVEPTKEILDNIGPGCFALKTDSSESCCFISPVEPIS